MIRLEMLKKKSTTKVTNNQKQIKGNTELHCKIVVITVVCNHGNICDIGIVTVDSVININVSILV